MSPVRRRQERPIHNRLKVLRAEHDLSRTELAVRVEVNPQTIGALERGDHDPSPDPALRICDVFGLPVEAVFARVPCTHADQVLHDQHQHGHRDLVDDEPLR